jgi:hypothetical protein
MKYNLGDKIIEIASIIFMTNPYHYRKAVKSICTIGSVDGDLFSPYENAKFGCIAGADQYMYYKRDTGTCLLHGKSKMLHLEKDVDEIRSIILQEYDKAKSKEESEISKQIKKYESDILMLKDRIHRLKNTGREFCGNIHIDFIEERKNEMLELVTKSGSRARQ